MTNRQNKPRLNLVRVEDPAVLAKLNAMATTVSDSTARRAAHNAGLIACKSRRRKHTPDNLGGFMIVEPYHNKALDGWKYDLSAREVVTFCQKYLQRV
jgi:hypothetical protein